MTSSNQDSKYLSAAIGHNSENAHTDETAGTRDDRQHSPYYRDYRRHAASGDDTAARTMLVTRLAGLLHALVETTDESTLPDMVPTDADASRHGDGAVDSEESDPDSIPVDPVVEDAAATARHAAPPVSTWRTPKSRYGTTAVPDGATYGVTRDGQPLVASKEMEMTALTNTGGQPHDTLLEPDTLAQGDALSLEDASPHELVDPSGDRVVGVASGFDEHASRFRAYDRPDPDTTEDSSDGVATAELDVTMPDGSLRPLGEVVDDPERFSRSSIETIEATLALEAELRKVSDGILDDGELVGHAKWLNNRFEDLETLRPSTAAIAEARERKARRTYKERIRPLTDLDEETNAEVRSLARRLLSEDFDRVHELRKSPLSVALELATRVQRGTDTTHALLEQADAEETDPRNVVKVGNVRYTRTDTTAGRVSTQGEVKLLFEPTTSSLKQAGVLHDDTGEIRFAIFKGSERDELAPTADPTDPGFTVVKHHSFPELREGDTVRFENVFKNWYRGEATIETRRDSEVIILERKSSSTSPSETSTSRRRTKLPARTGPRTGTTVPRPPAASWRGSERWIFPIVDWMPDWWLESDDVEPISAVTDDDHDEHVVCGSWIDAEGTRHPRCYRRRPEESQTSLETTPTVDPETDHVEATQRDRPTITAESESDGLDMERLYEELWEDHRIDLETRSSRHQVSGRSVLGEQAANSKQTETL
jgi:hypothetical protein